MKSAGLAADPLQLDDDASLVRRIVAGDRSAFATLMRRYNRRLYRLARATLHSETDAEDALQNAWLLAFRSMHQYRGDASVSTWLSRLTLNECFDRLRRNTRRQKVLPIVSSDSEADSVADADNDLPDQALNRSQFRDLLDRKVDELPRDLRTVFVLRSVEELSVEDAAQVLSIPEATVRTRHFRARSLLREALAKEIDLAERDVFEFGGDHCDRTVERIMAQLDHDR